MWTHTNRPAQSAYVTSTDPMPLSAAPSVDLHPAFHLDTRDPQTARSSGNALPPQRLRGKTCQHPSTDGQRPQPHTQAHLHTKAPERCIKDEALEPRLDADLSPGPSATMPACAAPSHRRSTPDDVRPRAMPTRRRSKPTHRSPLQGLRWAQATRPSCTQTPAPRRKLRSLWGEIRTPTKRSPRGRRGDQGS